MTTSPACDSGRSGFPLLSPSVHQGGPLRISQPASVTGQFRVASAGGSGGRMSTSAVATQTEVVVSRAASPRFWGLCVTNAARGVASSCAAAT